MLQTLIFLNYIFPFFLRYILFFTHILRAPTLFPDMMFVADLIFVMEA